MQCRLCERVLLPSNTLYYLGSVFTLLSTAQSDRESLLESEQRDNGVDRISTFVVTFEKCYMLCWVQKLCLSVLRELSSWNVMQCRL